jgi:arsenate reductase
VSARPCHVLFLCTGNSCRSIMAECILNRLGGDRFRGFSAGSRPTGAVHPRALALLERRGHPTAGLRAKGWEAFAGEGAPVMDAVITVCDAAAGEVCPVWPGRPARAHWGFPDPAAFRGGEAETEAFFAEVYARIEERIARFVNTSPGAPGRPDLRRRLADPGEFDSETAT